MTLVTETLFTDGLKSLGGAISFLDDRYMKKLKEIPMEKPIEKKNIWKAKDENGNWKINELNGDWTIKEFSTPEGVLLIRCLNSKIYYFGDRVYLNGQVAKDGKYVLDGIDNIKVKGGVIFEN